MEKNMSLYDDFIADDAVPIIFANSEGFVTDINRSFEETFRWPARLLVDQPLSHIIPEDLRDAHNMGFSRYIITENSTILDTPLNLKILCGDGKILMAQHLIVSLEKDGERILAAKITVL
jgi:PAS domain S-box-containing protein